VLYYSVELTNIHSSSARASKIFTILRHEGEHILYLKFRILSLGRRSALFTHEIATRHKRTVTSLEFIITRCWDGFAVHVRTVGRFEIDDKGPIQLSVRTQAVKKQGTFFMTPLELPDSSF